eukprot:TRINITY_DN3126_c0_g1_i1.p1 TRINITY_DN3126_c0_g1~~TRINITY_DN3126_c0_g1_i1.p1  ORF type:complete len:1106 (+),score=401.98 TRINITY_DN3126_c0_g1_i1:454-3318(+)
MIDIYRGKRRTEVAPHVYAISDNAYRNMLNDQQNQSMLITGESGAGKTENTKKVIQYMAVVAGRTGGVGTLETQILEANPILESFGNAKTLKNDNSSRFGKFIKIQFNHGGSITGATISSYLLEKSRVTWQARGERTFHIFYQLLDRPSTEDKKKYFLDRPENYKLFAGECYFVEGVNDSEEFTHTKNAMKVMGFSPAEQDSIFKLVAGILHLSNLPFEKSYGDAAVLKDKKSLENASALLKVSPTQLEQALVRPKIKAGTEVVSTQLDVDKASDSRNALCKTLYGRLFLWIVRKINSTLSQEKAPRFIGVLDIAGFEIFKHNSFEQLCINYTNERLQQFFNNHMFKLEQEEYMRENINWTFIDFGIDSQETIDLIEKKPTGLISLLEDECVFPKGTDETYLTKVSATHAKNPKYKKSQFNKKEFAISHYAGEVTYDVAGWLDKNKDPLQDDLEKTMKSSDDKFIRDLFVDGFLNEDGKVNAARKKAAIFYFVASQHKEGLGSLMSTLQATFPHFIRCIIPNYAKRPGALEAPIVLEQLRCNGVLEGIRITRKGFPNRLIYADFCKRYYILSKNLTRNPPDPKGAAKSILEELKIDPEQYRFGNTKVFFRTGTLAHIEEKREQKVGQMIVAIQAASRAFVARKLYKKVKTQRNAIIIIGRSTRDFLDFKKWLWWKLYLTVKPIIEGETLEKQLQDREDIIKAKKEEIIKEEETRKKIEQQLSEINAALEDARKNLQDQRNIHLDLEDEKNRLEKLKADLDRRQTSLEDELKDLEEQTKELNVLKANVTKRVEELQDHLNEETTARDALDRVKRSLESEIVSLKSETERANDSVNKLERSKQILEKEVLELKEMLATGGDNISKLETVKKGLAGEIKEVNLQLEEVGKKVESLEKTRKKLESDLKEKTQQVTDETALKQNLEAQKKKVETELDDLKSQLEQANSCLLYTSPSPRD